ncbi:hypothetical protein G5C51_35715 [Streptomyces sp. A7024]|uniref:ScoMcrA-like SRA domain-containing protein n=1 Tax=Streptomyces coryli TaxID=1128680 RepID=A0A6G4UDE3_9ACTN|nr:hypothetical protein [Streptomyces coryli]NGN69221.1 hypothetical protein [Streptomyces coryli]
MSMRTLAFQPGDILTRDDIRADLGGSKQGGICPSVPKRAISLFSDKSSGDRYGYRDGWLTEEDALGPIFEYTGAGSRGHQSFGGLHGKGNSAILRHVIDDRTLYLFTAVGRVPGTATKTHRYVGPFKLDEIEPYRGRQAVDDRQQLRSVIVFRLRPIDAYCRFSSDVIPPPSEPSTSFIPYSPGGRPVEPAEVRELRERDMSLAAVAARRRAALNDDFEAYRHGQGGNVGRLHQLVEYDAQVLVSGVFDAGDGSLCEPSESPSRAALRDAMGRLLDISQQVTLPGEDAPLRLMILSPGAPSAATQELLADYQIGLICQESDGTFTELRSGTRVRRSRGGRPLPCADCPAIQGAG